MPFGCRRHGKSAGTREMITLVRVGSAGGWDRLIAAVEHEKVGQEFWHHIVRTVSEKFKQGDLTGGLVAGIEAVGEDLARMSHSPSLRESSAAPGSVFQRL